MGSSYGMSEFRERRLPQGLAPALGVLAVGALFLASPVRTAAVGLLDTFRVQRFAAVTIDPSKLPFVHQTPAGDAATTPAPGTKHGDPNALGAYTGPLKLNKPQTVADLAAAEAKLKGKLADAGAAIAGQPLATVQVGEPVDASYTFDTAKLQAAIDQSGMKGVQAPEQLNGKTFTAHLPAAVFVRYGQGEEGALFAQAQSPALDIPDGVNMDYLRQDVLAIPGLPADLVAQLRAIQDWQHTLVLPLPPNGKSQDVKVAGNPGLLVSDAAGSFNAVLWQRQGSVYLLGGKLTAAQVQAAAAAVRYP